MIQIAYQLRPTPATAMFSLLNGDPLFFVWPCLFFFDDFGCVFKSNWSEILDGEEVVDPDEEPDLRSSTSPWTWSPSAQYLRQHF